MSRIFSSGKGAQYFMDNFYAEFNGKPENGDKMNNFDYTFTWVKPPRALTTANLAEQLIGSWQDRYAEVIGNNINFNIHNTIGFNSLFFGRQLGEYGLVPIGATRRDVNITIGWSVPIKEMVENEEK